MTRRIQDFVKLMPAIDELDITSSSERYPDCVYQALFESIDKSKLKKLRLDCISLSSKRLCALIYKIYTVEHLFLKDIFLEDGSWPTVLAGMPKSDHLHVYLNNLFGPNNDDAYYVVGMLCEPS